MKVLVIGSGGREHALLWKLAESSRVTKLYCAPGNGGTAQLATNVAIQATDIEKLVEFAKVESIGLTVVGMDDPLMLGVVDAFQAEGLRIFGPDKKAAIIEGSKVFAKDFMKKYHIPTAGYEVFDNSSEARHYIEKQTNYPVVIKADGLALGKGVLICENKQEALEGIQTIMEEKRFQEAGNRIVIEEFLQGPEVSVLAFCDGETVLPMVSAQDHKRAYDGNKGPNTGGMGTFSPSLYYTEDIAEYCLEYIYKPTLKGMKEEGRSFTGILFFGLMLTPNGPKTLEYNARFGDPETQVVLPRMKTDLLEVFEACVDSRLNELTLDFSEKAAVCVIMASGGYPIAYEKGKVINGLTDVERDILLFHAGTCQSGEGIMTNGGRVLGVTGLGATLEEARNNSYRNIEKINFEKAFYRKDISV